MASGARRRLLSADEFLRMAEAGILGEDDRVELLDSEIVEMSPQGDPHVQACQHLMERIVLAYAGTPYAARSMATFRAGSRSVPEPDFAVVSRTARGIVEVGKTILVVEVADTRLRVDREWKPSIYARAGAPLYWIVEIPYRRVRVLRDPGGGEYRSETVVDETGEVILPEVGRAVAVSALLPPGPG
jgi:Uma2 family endonuclease